MMWRLVFLHWLNTSSVSPAWACRMVLSPTLGVYETRSSTAQPCVTLVRECCQGTHDHLASSVVQCGEVGRQKSNSHNLQTKREYKRRPFNACVTLVQRLRRWPALNTHWVGVSCALWETILDLWRDQSTWLVSGVQWPVIRSLCVIRVAAGTQS